MRTKAWAGQPPGGGFPLDGSTPEDIVSSCIVQLLESPESWKRERGSLFKYMSLLIISEISRIHKRRENLITAHIGMFMNETEPLWGQGNYSVEISSAVSESWAYPANQEDALIFNDIARDVLKQKWSRDAQAVLETIVKKDITKPEELATYLGIAVQTIYGIKAELRRKLRPMLLPGVRRRARVKE
jgi:hypothetical protein